MANPEMGGPTPETQEKEIKVEGLADFDMEYFKNLEGKDGWIALGQENCKNQKYHTVIGEGGEKLGIVGVYDTEDEQNITHIVIDQKYRGKGLVPKFYEALMGKEDLNTLIATIDRKNRPSIVSHERAGFKKVSDEAYENEFDKFKYKYEKPQNE
ncbi:MAG: GNAT family N-acetyltransferase [Patescibacteria group bacterium]